MKIMVTGGTGFIGSALIRHLLGNTRHDIINLDKLTATANPRSLARAAQNLRYRFKQLDICNAEALNNQLLRNQPDVLVHLAAESRLHPTQEMHKQFIHTNYIGTFTLLDSLLNYWQELPAHKQQSFRLIHLSTSETWQQPFDSPGRTTQKGATDLIQAWHQTYGLPVILVDSSPAFGPCQFPAHPIPRTLMQALQHQPLNIDQPEALTHWLYIEDLIQGLLCAMQKGQIGQHYTLRPPKPTSQLTLTCTLCDLLDELQPANTSYRNLITFEANSDDAFHFASPPSRHSGTPPPDWQASHNLRSGLQKNLSWYLQNQEWVNSIITGEYRQRRTGNHRLIW